MVCCCDTRQGGHSWFGTSITGSGHSVNNRLKQDNSKVTAKVQNRIFCTQPKSSYYSLSPQSGLLAFFLGSTIGCRLARANASIAEGELPSVRITVPIDMKNLSKEYKSAWIWTQGAVPGGGRCMTQNQLTQM